MTGAIRAEWTKLRTLRSTAWMLLLAVGLTVALAAAITGSLEFSHCQAPCEEDTTELSLTGVRVGQVALVVLAVLAVGAEYGTGTIAPTLLAVPRRSRVLAGKLTVVVGLALVAGLLGVAGSLLLADQILPRNGFSAGHGFPGFSLSDGTDLRAAGGTVLYLSLVAALSVGVATIVRDTAAALVTVLGLLYLFPMLAMFVSEPRWERRLQQLSPMDAGLSVQATRGVEDLPIGPWAGLGVLAAYAATAVLLGALLLRTRDA